MRKNILTIMFAMLGVVAWAQQEKGTCMAQLKVGLNMAGFTSYDYRYHSNGNTKADLRYAMHLGVEGEYQVTNKFGLVFGVQYSMQGDREKLTDGSRLKITNKVDYINVPILAKVYVAKRWALKAGLQPAFNVKHDYEVTSSTSAMAMAGAGGNLSNIGIRVNDFDLALPIGIAYELASVTRNCLVIEARWNPGLLKMADMKEGKAPNNLVFQLSLGYKVLL